MMGMGMAEGSFLSKELAGGSSMENDQADSCTSGRPLIRVTENGENQRVFGCHCLSLRWKQ